MSSPQARSQQEAEDDSSVEDACQRAAADSWTTRCSAVLSLQKMSSTQAGIMALTRHKAEVVRTLKNRMQDSHSRVVQAALNAISNLVQAVPGILDDDLESVLPLIYSRTADTKVCPALCFYPRSSLIILLTAQDTMKSFAVDLSSSMLQVYSPSMRKFTQIASLKGKWLYSHTFPDPPDILFPAAIKALECSFARALSVCLSDLSSKIVPYISPSTKSHGGCGLC